MALASVAMAANHALRFDGQHQYLDCGPCDELHQPIQNITIECWFRTGYNGNIEQVVMTNRHDQNGSDFTTVTLRVGGHINFCCDDANYRNDIQSRNAVNDNQWHHVACVKDGNTWTLYVDGEQDAQMNDAHQLSGSPHNLHIGHHAEWTRSNNAYTGWTGDLDEVRIWSVPRTADEIQNSMHSALQGDEDGLYAYWNFNEGEGQIAGDVTGHDHDGVLGADDREGADDPEWIDSDSPIFSGELALSRNTIHFPPTAIDHPRSEILTLQNLSQEGDEQLNIQFEFTFPDNELPSWLNVEPLSGNLPGGQRTDVTLIVHAEDLEPGDYQTTMSLSTNAVNMHRVEFPVTVTLVRGVGRLFGIVTDETDHRPVEGAVVRMSADYVLADTTDAEGFYEFLELPVFNYILTVTKTDFLPTVTDEVNIADGQEIEYNFSLLHADFTPSSNMVDASLPVDDEYESILSVTNTGNGPLTWSVERVFPEEHIVDPWEVRQMINAGASLEDDRIEGVAFDGDHFYFAGAAGADSSKIYVLDRDGEFVRSFDQLTHTRYGMKDLEWDGELLWGSGESVIFGFDVDGNEAVSFNAPFNPTNCIAYDHENDILWLSGTTTNIAAYDREGNALGPVLNRKGLRMYGLAYWPEDPDGYCLYIFDTSAAGIQLVHKMNTANGDTMLARAIPVENGEAPTGAFICNDYDPYAWVMIGMQNRSPNEGGDRAIVWQLGARTDWVQIAPQEGVIDAGESQDVTVRFNSSGMVEDLRMDATLVFTHDGVGGLSVIPVAMNVTGEGGLTQRTVRLVWGWNLVSTNITPEGVEAFDSLLTPLVEAGSLILAKDQDGNFFYPARGFNNIDDWNGLQSYWMKMTVDAEIRLAGVSMAFDHEVPLRSGWNNVSYLPRQPVEATVALSGLGENLVIARDGSGRFYIPEYGFSDIGPMREGLGYQMNVREESVLVYHLAGRAVSLSERYSLAQIAWLQSITRTTCQHNLLVKSDLEVGTHLEALTTSGLVAGRGVVGVDGLAGLTLWGDDPTTTAVEGFTEGESVTINGAPLNSQLSTLNFMDGSWGIIDVSASTAPVSFGLSETFPNPFNGELRVTFGLTSPGKMLLRAFDLTGREVAVILSGNMESGQYRIVWQATDLSTGLYLLRLESAGQSSSVKVLLVK